MHSVVSEESDSLECVWASVVISLHIPPLLWELSGHQRVVIQN